MDCWILECGTGSARAMLLKTALTFGQAKKKERKKGGKKREKSSISIPTMLVLFELA